VAIDGGDTRLEGDTLYLSPTLFSAYGFGDITVAGGNLVELGREGAALSLTPQLVTRAIDGIGSASRTSLDGLGTLAIMPRAFRDEGMRLAFESASDLLGTVRVHEGTRIAVDAGGEIELSANRSLEVAGQLTAPGGRIALRMAEPQQDDIYYGASIFVAPSARLDVSGTFVATPNIPYVDGTLYGGGTIDIAARRGYLVIQDGAELRADGSSAVLTQRIGSLGTLTPTRIDSSGGLIALNAREGLYADPLLSAKAGGANAYGGALSVTLDQGSNNWGDLLSLPPALTGPRTLDIVQSGNSGSAAFVPGAAPSPATYAGRGVFALDALDGSGIADLTLAVRGNGGNAGTLRFGEDVTQAVSGRMVLDAANIAGANGADVKLSAAVLDWTNVGRVQQNHTRPTAVQAGDGTLTLSADLINVAGNLAASRFSKVTLAAQGDLRASASPAYLSDGARLVTSGDLTLRAAQVYPTSASNYAFEIHNNASGTLRVESSGRAAAHRAGRSPGRAVRKHIAAVADHHDDRRRQHAHGDCRWQRRAGCRQRHVGVGRRLAAALRSDRTERSRLALSGRHRRTHRTRRHAAEEHHAERRQHRAAGRRRRRGQGAGRSFRRRRSAGLGMDRRQRRLEGHPGWREGRLRHRAVHRQRLCAVRPVGLVGGSQWPADRRRGADTRFGERPAGRHLHLAASSLRVAAGCFPDHAEAGRPIAGRRPVHAASGWHGPGQRACCAGDERFEHDQRQGLHRRTAEWRTGAHARRIPDIEDRRRVRRRPQHG
jgi:hypothetical protein